MEVVKRPTIGSVQVKVRYWIWQSDNSRCFTEKYATHRQTTNRVGLLHGVLHRTFESASDRPSSHFSLITRRATSSDISRIALLIVLAISNVRWAIAIGSSRTWADVVPPGRSCQSVMFSSQIMFGFDERGLREEMEDEGRLPRSGSGRRGHSALTVWVTAFS